MNINTDGSYTIENIDIKKSIDWLDEENSHIIGDINKQQINGTTLWTCNNFLSESECNEIIKKGEENTMEYLKYRNSHRIIGMDNNNNLVKTIANRLEQKQFINKINKCKCNPYGFNSYDVNWDENRSSQINTCFRMNKYESSNFEIHRDAQLTVSKTVKSNYTMLIYLNDNFEGGDTTFQIPDESLIDINKVYNGISASEESELIKEHSIFHNIKPSKGTCVIFDQRILHKSAHSKGIKYVLRTDLINTGTIKNKNEQLNNSVITSLENLTKCLFRQAQLNELNKIDCDVDLYGLCLNIRQFPHKLKTVPVHLNKYLSFSQTNIPICSNLTFDGRTGQEYKFKYNTEVSNKLELVKLSVLFCVYSLITRIDTDFVNKFNTQIKNLGINLRKNCEKEDVDKNTYLDSYHCDFKDINDYFFVEDLVKNIRIRNRGCRDNDRTVFDLTHAVTMNNGTYTVVDKNDFSNNYNVSIHKMFKNLFSIKINDFRIFDSNVIKYKPMTTLATFSVANMDIYEKKYGCGSSCGQYGNSFIDVKNAKGIFKVNFTTQPGDNVVNLYDVVFNNEINVISGLAKITTPKKFFNHAACNCEYSENKVMHSIGKIYATIDYSIKFKITDTTITLEINPFVVI